MAKRVTRARFLRGYGEETLSRVNATALSEMSDAIHRRSSRCATAGVVPLPQKKSPTTSPGSVNASTKTRSNASGFCVG